MYPTLTRSALTADVSLDEFVARLAAHEVVEGIALFGSASREEECEHSDYDLWIVVSRLPVPLQRVHTYIDHRLTDLNIITWAEGQRLVAQGGQDSSSDAAQHFRQLRSWKILYDRAGRLHQAEQAVARWVQPVQTTPRADLCYRLWFDCNSRLRHTIRHMESSDPAVLTALDLRLAADLQHLLTSYFHIRGIAWYGDKYSLRYLAEHDARYLAALQACLHAADRAERVALYRELVCATIAPVGDLWPPRVTAVQVGEGADAQSDPVGAALTFWQTLVAVED